MQVIDFLYANSGWQFGEVARAVNKGVGRLMELAGSDRSPDGIPLASWLQQQYNWIGFVAVSDPGPGKLIDVDLCLCYCTIHARQQPNIPSSAAPWGVGEGGGWSNGRRLSWRSRHAVDIGNAGYSLLRGPLRFNTGRQN